MVVFSFVVSAEMLVIWAGFLLGLNIYWQPAIVKSRLPSKVFSEGGEGSWRLVVTPGADLWG